MEIMATAENECRLKASIPPEITAHSLSGRSLRPDLSSPNATFYSENSNRPS